jgi:hypothetical protein
LPERSRSRGSPCNSTSALVHGQKLSHGKAILARKAEESAMHRRLALDMSLVMAFFLASQCAFADPPATKIDPESFKLIKQGMTQKQVEEILGGPPRDERTDNIYVPVAFTNLGSCGEIWNSSVCQISVGFDFQERRVFAASMSPPNSIGTWMVGTPNLVNSLLDDIVQSRTLRLWQITLYSLPW